MRLYAAKLATLALSVMHRNYSYAGRTCYENLPRLSRQNGQAENNHRHNRQNGKTTPGNMINYILADNWYFPVNNRAGKNNLGGVATTLISAVNSRGKTVKDLAVLELDERSSRLIYPYVHPILTLHKSF